MCGIFSAINSVNFFAKRDIQRFVKSPDMVAYRGPRYCGLFNNRLFPKVTGNIKSMHMKLSI